MDKKSSAKVCFVTGSRADYGLLYWVMKRVKEDNELQLQIVVTGMHLSPEFGLTYRFIEEDGFHIDAKVEMLLSGDTSVAITKSVGLATIGFSDVLDRLRPDLLVVLGDRSEIFAAVQAALFHMIPVAHIAGGDITEGAYDDAIRHSITKMSHLHFVTNHLAYKRVCQMGESPSKVFLVGSPGLDYIHNVTLMNKEELEKDLQFEFKNNNILVTFHPVTLDNDSADKQFDQLLTALDKLGQNIGILFTKPNSDKNGRSIITKIDQFVDSHPNSKAFLSLGQRRYLSTIQWVDAVVGNSSSGLYEVPSFKKPTVNIGDRQKGRILAQSVISCPTESESIYSAILKAIQLDCSKTTNPYGDGNSSEHIVSLIKENMISGISLKKSFCEME